MSYEPVPFRTEAERVAAFARAVGADPEAGVPPTYAFVGVFESSAQIVLDPALNVNFAMLVHGEQEFTWERHPEVGEELRVEGRVAKDEERRGLRFLTLVNDIRQLDGAPVATARMLDVIRG